MWILMCYRIFSLFPTILVMGSFPFHPILLPFGHNHPSAFRSSTIRDVSFSVMIIVGDLLFPQIFSMISRFLYGTIYSLRFVLFINHWSRRDLPRPALCSELPLIHLGASFKPGVGRQVEMNSSQANSLCSFHFNVVLLPWKKTCAFTTWLWALRDGELTQPYSNPSKHRSSNSSPPTTLLWRKILRT